MKFQLIRCLALLPILASAQDKPVFKAGAATSNITPPLGMEIVGNFAPRPIAKHVHDELHVRCLVLDDGTTKLAFAVVDNLHLPRDAWDEAKKKLEADTGIPASHMMFSATHTHSSVSAITNEDPSLNYRRLVISRVVDGVKRALNNLEPARIAWGTGKLPQWVGNRRWLLKEGITNPNPFGGEDRVVMNPSSALIPRLAGPAGPTNPEVYCLSVQATDGRQIALMANYWLHYVGGVNREDLSADYFGEFCRRIEQELGAPCVGLLANGPCGDVNSNDYSGKTRPVKYEPYEKIKVVANDLAQVVLRVRETLTYQDWVPLQAAASDLELAVRRPTPEMIQWAEGVLAKPKDTAPVHRLEQPYAERVMASRNAKPDTIQAYIQAFRIGELGIASIPFEVFVETGLEIKARSPFKDTFTIELANGTNGYLPTPRQLDLGGYETWLGTNRVEREASEKITARAVELLKTVRANGFAADWPGWRGPARDGHPPPGSVFPQSLPREPRRVWQLEIGEGLASPVVAGNKVFYLDAQEGKEVIHALDRNSGRELWRAPLDDTFKNAQTAPGPRCAPLVDGDRVYAQSCNGELRCLAVADGQLKWRVNFTREFHAGVPAERGLAKGAQRHGFTASPWVDGHRLLALVGDSNGAGVVCFDKFTGKVLWQSQNDRAANAAPVTALIAGSAPKQVVAFTVEGLIGLNLQTGELLWRIPVTTTHGRHVTTPVIVGNIVMVASKEESMMGIELAPEPVAANHSAPKWNAAVKWQTKDHEVNFSSPVAVDGYIYGLGPDKNLFCLETKTGKSMWSKEGFTMQPAEKAHLAIVVLGENLLLLTETGELVLVAADPKEFKELGRAQVCGTNWCSPAYADGKLFLRDARELICVDLLP